MRLKITFNHRGISVCRETTPPMANGKLANWIKKTVETRMAVEFASLPENEKLKNVTANCKEGKMSRILAFFCDIGMLLKMTFRLKTPWILSLPVLPVILVFLVLPVFSLP